MCLAVLGKIISINDEQELLMRTGKISFDGVIKEVSLAYVPEAKADDYVIVHAGFAIGILNPQSAESTLNYLQKMQRGEIH